MTDKATTEEAEAATAAGDAFGISIGTLHGTEPGTDAIALRFMVEGRQAVAAVSPADAVMMAQEIISRAMAAGLQDYVATLCLKHRDTQDQILSHIALTAEALITAGERLNGAVGHNNAFVRAYGLLYAQNHAALLSHMNNLVGLWIMCPQMEDTVEVDGEKPAEAEPAPAEAEPAEAHA